MPRPCFFPLFTNDLELEEVYSEGRAPNSPRGNLLPGEDGRACRTLRLANSAERWQSGA